MPQLPELHDSTLICSVCRTFSRVAVLSVFVAVFSCTHEPDEQAADSLQLEQLDDHAQAERPRAFLSPAESAVVAVNSSTSTAINPMIRFMISLR